ncbi:dethiobiotin synthase [Ginsengibacter hankyongi]|uniref:ATP-dependent dethiobiotin synthetase BioD n=1 Tax=Ginsengibacter hankyongi TaxID=2607284 RepID=A0A5J5IAV9_9BACT|nr:dethiobiotin synthase [Ginsengibacter hankyongi]KAA9034618.1 dethiobiotin synthase [Ginsengibacter hankyongi]
MKPIFITGTGTDVGKTLVAAIVTEALQADYWKPVQAGFAGGTDSLWIEQMISNNTTKIHPEIYKLKMPASPHLAAKAEDVKIVLKDIVRHLPKTKNTLIIEGAGGLMVPLNKREFIRDLLKKLKAKVIIVSKNELGSINHSLLTAAVLKKEKIDVAGWIFNEQYLNYENEIANWSGYPLIASVPHLNEITKETIKAEAEKMKESLQKLL